MGKGENAMKCVKRAISFDGMNLRFRGKVIQKAPKDMRECTGCIPKSRMDEVKEKIFAKVCEV